MAECHRPSCAHSSYKCLKTNSEIISKEHENLRHMNDVVLQPIKRAAENGLRAINGNKEKSLKNLAKIKLSLIDAIKRWFQQLEEKIKANFDHNHEILDKKLQSVRSEQGQQKRFLQGSADENMRDPFNFDLRSFMSRVEQYKRRGRRKATDEPVIALSILQFADYDVESDEFQDRVLLALEGGQLDDLLQMREVEHQFKVRLNTPPKSQIASHQKQFTDISSISSSVKELQINPTVPSVSLPPSSESLPALARGQRESSTHGPPKRRHSVSLSGTRDQSCPDPAERQQTVTAIAHAKNPFKDTHMKNSSRGAPGAHAKIPNKDAHTKDPKKDQSSGRSSTTAKITVSFGSGVSRSLPIPPTKVLKQNFMHRSLQVEPTNTIAKRVGGPQEKPCIRVSPLDTKVAGQLQQPYGVDVLSDGTCVVVETGVVNFMDKDSREVRKAIDLYGNDEAKASGCYDVTVLMNDDVIVSDSQRKVLLIVRYNEEDYEVFLSLPNTMPKGITNNGEWLFVNDSLNGCVQKIHIATRSLSGNIDLRSPEGESASSERRRRPCPNYLAMNGQGDLLISDALNGILYIVDKDENVKPLVQTGIAQLSRPSGICWLDNRRFVVAVQDSKCHQLLVVEIPRRGQSFKVVNTFGRKGHLENEFNSPQGIVKRNDWLFVCDLFNSRLHTIPVPFLVDGSSV